MKYRIAQMTCQGHRVSLLFFSHLSHPQHSLSLDQVAPAAAPTHPPTRQPDRWRAKRGEKRRMRKRGGVEDGGTDERLFLCCLLHQTQTNRSGRVGAQGVRFSWFLLSCKELHIQKTTGSLTVEPGSDVMCLKKTHLGGI